MKIGLLGFGVVGRGVYELTRGRDDMQVVKVLRREDMQLPDAKTVRDIRDIVEDDSIDTVVEVMGGLHPAYDYVRAAIEAGKNVVTANKALVCTFYDELLPLHSSRGRRHRLAFRAGTRPPGAEHPGGRRHHERHLQLYSRQHDPSGSQL